MMMMVLLFGVFFSCVHVVWFVDAGKSTIRPEISFGIRGDDIYQQPFSSILGTLEPNLKWTTSGTIPTGQIDYEGGVTIKGEQNGTLPYSVWGRFIKKNLLQSGWNVASRFDTSSDELERIQLDVQVNGGPTNLKIQLKGVADVNEFISFTNDDKKEKSSSSSSFFSIKKETQVSSKKNLLSKIFQFSTIKATQSIDTDVGVLTVSPSLNLKKVTDSDISVSLGLNDGDTIVTATGNQKKQKYILNQRIGEHNSIQPTITSTGTYNIEYCRSIGETGLGTIFYQPDTSITLKYEDYGWVANLITPLIPSSSSNTGNFFSSKSKIDTQGIQFIIRKSIS